STVTKGAGPNWSQFVDPNTNRVAGSYDANGNMILAPNGSPLLYDVENRLTQAGYIENGSAEFYAYAPGNKRIWKKKPNGSEEFYFYGISGQKLGTYGRGAYPNGSGFLFVAGDVNLYFGSRTIVSNGASVALDRLGSNRTGGSRYFPYGEEQ